MDKQTQAIQSQSEAPDCGTKIIITSIRIQGLLNLSLCLFIQTILLFSADSRQILNDDTNRKILEQILNLHLLLDLAGFFIGLLVLYLLWAGICALAAAAVIRVYHYPLRANLLVFIIATTLLFGLNSKLFGLASTAVFSNTLLSSGFFLTILALLLFSPALFQAFRIMSGWSPTMRTVAMLGIIGVLIGLYYPASPPSVVRAGHTTPDIIIIGIDALRPDKLGINGFSPSLTPNIDHFLQSSEIYSNTFTPVARTFASWSALLTGKHPVNNKVRFNLIDKRPLDLKDNMVAVLRKNHFHTIHAMDERRFSHIDEDFGFDEVVGPKAGAADFLISLAIGHPVLDLFCETRFCKWFFPYVYSNRAYPALYRPETFIDEIEHALHGARGKPVFLTVHLTLPHYPFISRGMQVVQGHGKPTSYNESVYFTYLSMLQLVDEQFKQLMAMLQRLQFIENSHIYLISDHGESFDFSTDRLTPGNPYTTFATNAPGHGTKITDLEQFRVLLARKTPQTRPSRSNELKSLIDIYPTVLNDLGIRHGNQLDGMPLSDSNHDRHLYLESSFGTTFVPADSVDVEDIIRGGISFYEVNPQGQVRLMPDKIDLLMYDKQRGIIYRDWLLALFPDLQDELILVNHKTGVWWPASTPVEGLNAPAYDMFNQLCEHYRDDTGFDQNKLCGNETIMDSLKKWSSMEARTTMLPSLRNAHREL